MKIMLEACLRNNLVHLNETDCWKKYSSMFEKLDVYYSQEYVSLFAKVQNGAPEAVYYEDEDGRVFYPYIKRKIELMEGYFDIITPYGYGGPVLEGKPCVIKKFYSLFREHCLKNNIVTETIGLHPLIKNDEYIRNVMDVDLIRKTTAVDLTSSLEEIRKNYSSNNKRNIKRAKKEGVSVFVSSSNRDIETFIDLYMETMTRNKASSFYYFNPSYFYRQMEETELSKSYLLLAQYNGEIIGGVLIIIGKEYAHYHLGASKTEFLSLRPNNLLFDIMIEFCKSFGLEALHLGGGYVDNDSLFKFKSSFTNNLTFHYFLGKNIFDEKRYIELTLKVKNDNQFDNNRDFFPIYRK